MQIKCPKTHIRTGIRFHTVQPVRRTALGVHDGTTRELCGAHCVTATQLGVLRYSYEYHSSRTARPESALRCTLPQHNIPVVS